MVSETAQKTITEQFHDLIHSNHMYGLWELASLMTERPESQAIAYMWPWSVMKNVVEQSGEAVPVGEERRAMQLFNPGLDGRWATTSTLVAAVQVLLPGEVARAHRHTPTAIRFIMQGSGAYTKVDGERVYMEPGDFVLTPSWSWHDHGNDSQNTVVWLDGLDVPLVKALEAIFFQYYDQRQVPDTREPSTSNRLHGNPGLSPTWIKERAAYSPLLLYSWNETWAALSSLRNESGDSCDGIRLEYSNPQTGGSVLPSMACSIQLLRPGEHLNAHRHTGSAVYYAHRGSGVTVIDGQAFDWSEGDIISLPSWSVHEHANASSTEDAVLFCMTDVPVLKATGLYREEPFGENGGHQQVTSRFAAV
jgi:gentisate 1,2-dioxygenase